MDEQQTELTADTIQQAREMVQRYASRNATWPVIPGSGGNGYFDLRQAETDEAMKGFKALSADRRAEIVRYEDAIDAYDKREERLRQERAVVVAKAERLRESECRLRDEDRRLVCYDQLVETPAVAAARGWYRERREACCVINGGCGSGKTIATADLIANHPYTALFLDADTAVKVFNASFGEQFDTQKAARNTNLLVLDDVGTEADASKMLAVLLTLHNARKSAKEHPWLVTTNLNKRDFAARYPNERLLSRMNQTVWISVTDGDFRKGMK